MDPIPPVQVLLIAQDRQAEGRGTLGPLRADMIGDLNERREGVLEDILIEQPNWIDTESAKAVSERVFTVDQKS